MMFPYSFFKLGKAFFFFFKTHQTAFITCAKFGLIGSVILESQCIYSLFCYHYNPLEKDLIIQVNNLIPVIQEGVLDRT